MSANEGQRITVRLTDGQEISLRALNVTLHPDGIPGLSSGGPDDIYPRPHTPDSIFARAVADELVEARDKYDSFNSLHEGWATLYEEVEELWEEIRKKPSKRSRKKLFREAVQVGAMVQRLAEDCYLVDDYEDEDSD